MRHMLHERLVWKLLRTVGDVLCGVSWRGGHDRRACCWGRVHHGALMVLILPLLGHIWYCRQDDLGLEKSISRIKHMNTVHEAVHDWTCLPFQCHAMPLPLPLQPLWTSFLPHMGLVLSHKHEFLTLSLDNSDSSFRCQPESKFLGQTLYNDPQIWSSPCKRLLQHSKMFLSY